MNDDNNTPGGDCLAAAINPHNDRMVTEAQVTAEQLQDALLQCIQESSAIDMAKGTVDSHLVVEALAATLLPFAIMGNIREDVLCDRIRELYRMVEQQLAGAKPGSRLIVPGKG